MEDDPLLELEVFEGPLLEPHDFVALLGLDLLLDLEAVLLELLDVGLCEKEVDDVDPVVLNFDWELDFELPLELDFELALELELERPELV